MEIIFKIFNFSYLYNIFLFKNISFTTKIGKQLIITNKDCISLGKRVVVFPNGRIELIKKYAGETFEPCLIIGEDSQIHQNCHITCADRITIGKKTIIVANVTITDIIHPHEDLAIPTNSAKIKTKPVSIGDETYIYNNCVILPGSQIGRNCVIGANSVVTSNIPDYSIAVGNPAQVIKRYNFQLGKWQPINVVQ